MLREESDRVAEARAALRRGDASAALAQLEQIRTRFPAGGLVQEREALTIEALARSGRRADASARAAAFLRAYPTSVHSQRVQGYIQDDARERPAPLQQDGSERRPPTGGQ
jgi:outer membrane protein assembly factor BamD (BamD/ComL family)